jgi:hypothetical protein
MENAYLQSTPGRGGGIRAGRSGYLTRFVPKRDERRPYIEIVEEALKDFRYDWVRLVADLRGGALNLQFLLHGAPGGQLPFSFDMNKGAFVRVKPAKSNADFSKGIDLALRLNDLAVADILYHRDTLELIFQGHSE